eukprot:COSAG04_NODE_50_length_31170_cov_2.965080_10_plen_77_part_00
MTFETLRWHADTHSHGFYNLFALCYLCQPHDCICWDLNCVCQRSQQRSCKQAAPTYPPAVSRTIIALPNQSCVSKC